MAPLLSRFLMQQRLAAVAPYLCGEVLDLGCGSSPVIARLQPSQAYVGVDWRADTVGQLRARYPNHEFYERDIDTQPLALPRRFDTVVLLAVIEHLRRPEHLFSQVCDVLRPGGRVVMTSPSAWGNRLHGWGAQVGLFSHEAADEHHSIFSRVGLEARIRPHGLALVAFRYFELGCNQLFVCQARPPDA